MTNRVLWGAVSACCLAMFALVRDHGESAATGTDLHRLPVDELRGVVDEDLTAVMQCRNGLHDTVEFVRAHPELFPTDPADMPQVPTVAQRREVASVWSRVLDYYVVLDAIQLRYDSFWRFPGHEGRAKAFSTERAAFVVAYRWALELLAILDAYPGFQVLLNEAKPALGIEADSFAAFQFHFLNVARGAEFAAFALLAGRYRSEALPSALEVALGEDAAAIWRMGRGKGEVMTARNALRVLRRAGHRVWLPLQAGMAEWMGNTKVWRRGRYLITEAQVMPAMPLLCPGDVFFEKREWHLSNLGIPGFWSHMALYIGTPQERASVFATDEVRDWVREQGVSSGDLEELLRITAGDRYQECLEQGEAVPRVIEALAPGVIFTTLERSAGADSWAVLRPRVPEWVKARALVRAFAYLGRPYDFSFDFRSDNALVCSELVYKAYEPEEDGPGLELPVEEVAGRPVLPPNQVVQLFARDLEEGETQFDFVLFLDGYERQGRAVHAQVVDLAASWERPKWHVFVR